MTILFVCPVLNEEELLPKLIESLLIQTNPKWQLLICDNASTDSTLDIAKSWAEKDNRIKVTHFEVQKNSAFESWVQSLEYALTIDGYDYIQIIPGDDFLHTNTYVENAFKIISVKNVSGVIPRFIYNSREVVLNSINHKSLFTDWHYVHLVFGVYKTKHLERAFRKLLKLRKNGSDFDWWLTFFLISETIVYSPEMEFCRSTKATSGEFRNSDNFPKKRKRFKSLRRALSPLRRSYDKTLREYRHYILLGGSISLYERGVLFIGFVAKTFRIL